MNKRTKRDEERILRFQSFKKDLKALLEKHGASLEVEFAGDVLSAIFRANVDGLSGVLAEGCYVNPEELDKEF